jgi:SAM-dependent methyltransferase
LNEIENLWQFKASARFASDFKEIDLSYSEIPKSANNEAVLRVLNALNSDLIQVGAHRSGDWEKGWQENFENYKRSKNLNDVIPKYFNKIPLIRWKQEWIQPNSPTMEYDMLGLIVNFITDSYLESFSNIYEFGCGTGHNLLRIRNRLPDVNLIGLDWATSSQALIRQVAVDTSDPKFTGENFDYFKPNQDLKIKDNSAVITVASLEQTGSKFNEFIDYLVAQKPSLVIHIEPMWEPLDETNLMDYLSIKYFEKRSYLNGLQKYIENLEIQGTAEIIKKERTYVGSFFIDGYSLLVWKPN